MVARILNALDARRKQMTEKEKGFTLIELLVVVIIIGILAAIAIPVYLGVQDNAKDSSAQSDVVNLKTAIVSMQTSKGGVLPTNAEVMTGTPPVLTADATKAGASVSSNTSAMTYKPAVTPSVDFCVAAKSSSGSVFYALASGGALKVEGARTLPTTCTAP